MGTHRLRAAIVAIFSVTFACGIVIAQDAPPPDPAAAGAPPNYYEMRRSKDVRTRSTAERYLNLIKTQEWTSDKGTKITAKWVAHADDLSSVTLSVIRGSGASRTVKEVTVPTNRLDKRCQTRVKQIATLQKLLDELAAAAPADPNQPGATPPSPNPGAPMMDEVGAPARRPPRRPPPRRRAPPPEAPTAPTPSAPASVPDDSGDDPLGFGDVTSDALPMQVPPLTENAVPAEQPAQPAVLASDPDAWRTNFEAFRANIQVPDGDAFRVNFGPMKALQEASNEVRKYDSVGDEEHRKIAEKFAAVGEFTWETTLVDGDTSHGDWTERLNMPPLPKGMTIGFLLDETNPGNWQSLKTGDRVRFTGRFVDDEEGDLVAHIRFPAEQPTSSAAAAVPSDPNTADPKQWASDYTAFRANFKIALGEQGVRVEWGNLEALRDAGAALPAEPQDGSVPTTAPVAVDGLPEVRWEANFAGHPPGSQNYNLAFDMLPLPSPMRVEFRMDDQEGRLTEEESQRIVYSAGKRLRFTGRLAMSGPHTIVVYVSKPEVVGDAPAGATFNR